MKDCLKRILSAIPESPPTAKIVSFIIAEGTMERLKFKKICGYF